MEMFLSKTAFKIYGGIALAVVVYFIYLSISNAYEEAARAKELDKQVEALNNTIAEANTANAKLSTKLKEREADVAKRAAENEAFKAASKKTIINLRGQLEKDNSDDCVFSDYSLQLLRDADTTNTGGGIN